MSSGNCKSCRNWWRTATGLPHRGECLISSGYDEPQESLAWAFEASLYTHETFGCVQYKPVVDAIRFGGWGLYYKPFREDAFYVGGHRVLVRYNRENDD
jgi:hypothetical protein